MPSHADSPVRFLSVYMFVQVYTCVCCTFLRYHHLSSPYYVSMSHLSSVSILKIAREALSDSGWCQAMTDKKDALHSNGIWELVSLPPINYHLSVANGCLT